MIGRKQQEEMHYGSRPVSEYIIDWCARVVVVKCKSLCAMWHAGRARRSGWRGGMPLDGCSIVRERSRLAVWSQADVAKCDTRRLFLHASSFSLTGTGSEG